MTNRILRAAFLVWTAIWLFLIARELLVKEGLRDYMEFLGRPLEGKWERATGQRLYNFVRFCRENMPAGASFKLVGLEEGSLDRRRAIYLLYPHLESADADYTLFYGGMCAEKEGQIIVAGLGSDGCILRKAGRR